MASYRLPAVAPVSAGVGGALSPSPALQSSRRSPAGASRSHARSLGRGLGVPLGTPAAPLSAPTPSSDTAGHLDAFSGVHRLAAPTVPALVSPAVVASRVATVICVPHAARRRISL